MTGEQKREGSWTCNEGRRCDGSVCSHQRSVCAVHMVFWQVRLEEIQTGHMQSVCVCVCTQPYIPLLVAVQKLMALLLLQSPHGPEKLLIVLYGLQQRSRGSKVLPALRYYRVKIAHVH